MFVCEDIDGTAIRYKVLGSGAPLVLIHGFGGNPNNWNEVGLAMAKSYRVIIPNLVHLFISPNKSTPLSEQVKIFSKFL